MDFTAECLATEPVAEFVDDLDRSERDPHVNDGLKSEKLPVTGQFRKEEIPVAGHEADGREHNADADGQEPSRENEPQRRHHFDQEAVRIENGDFNVENIEKGLRDLILGLVL